MNPNVFLFSSSQYLDVSENELNELPESFQYMSELGSLDVSSNNITSLPASFGPKQLKSFNAARNQITSLPPIFAECKEMEVLNLEGNPVDASFWSLVVNFTKLRELYH